jgi:hypothetical protein
MKSRFDNFFSDEIFIQEAIELMNPGTKKTAKVKSDVGLSEKDVKELVSKAKTNLINKESANKDIATVLEAKEKIPDVEKLPDVKTLREKETKMPEVAAKTLVIDEEIYSNDLLFATQFSTIVPQAEPTESEIKEKILNELFCEETYKKKIIKKLFHKDEILFKDSVNKLLDINSWNNAIPAIEKLFDQNKVEYYCEEAVKFVDIMQSHFTKTTVYSSQKQQGT